MSKAQPSREERIAKLRGGLWIRYTRAEEILAKLEDLYEAPRMHRMPNLLLAGDTNNGKTMIARRFYERHRPHIHLDQQASQVPVIFVQAPPVPDEGRFYNAILSELYTPFRASARVDQRQLQVLRLLEAVDTRVLIIDEIHHILAGTVAKQRHFLNMLKYLGNELQIPIVAVGTRDAFNAIHTDPQLANRFEPAFLPKWKMDEEYHRLLASLGPLIPLEQQETLAEPQLAAQILALSEGTIGEICELLRLAALYAIRTGIEKITEGSLTECGYRPPSSRRRPPEL
jgi:type II secretory pathway predicted ATPase ExeA